MNSRVLSMKTTKQKKDYSIEKVITMNPALEIVILLYLSILRYKPHRFYLLGHGHTYWGTSMRTVIRYP